MSADAQPTTTLHLRGRPLLLAQAAWLLIAGLTLLLVVIAIPHYYASPHSTDSSVAQLGLPPHFLVIYNLVFDLAVMLPFTAVAAVLFWRRAGDAMALFVSITLLTSGAANSFIISFLTKDPSPWGWAASCLYAFGVACGFSLLYMFPDGRPVPRWARGMLAVYALWALAQFVWPAARPIYWPLPLVAAVVVGSLALGAGAQIYRYRRWSTPLQRQQTKWVVLGLAAVAIGSALTEIPRLVFPALTHGTPAVLYLLLFLVPVSSGAYILLALSIGLSILRYRLYEVDFVINRSLVYGALTALMAGVFAAILFVVSQVTRGQSSLLAFGVAAVCVGLLFQPARRRLQRFVDQRFYNIQIDYQKTPAPAPSLALSPDTRPSFGPYRGLELIGRGGMGEVYKTDHPTLNRPIALKLLPAQLVADADFRQRFQREAKIATTLRHPNIVQVLESGEVNGIAYMAMELLEGKDLAAHLRERGRWPLAEALPILQMIAAALDYAHQQGIVHRDIKPSNVMLDAARAAATPTPPDPGLRPVLTDFGIAKILGGHTAMTRTGMLGTLDYMAPEQIQDSANVDGRADVYAFGVLVYQMLTGELPFKQQNPGALLIAHLTQPPPDAQEIAADLPHAAATAVQCALAKSPEARFATAGEFAAALGE